MELWAGHECTINRVGDRYCDQSDLSGFSRRDGDIDRFAALGISALRYPVLWEQIASGARDLSWHAARLDRLRTLGVRPIIGLLHHGSGPGDTDLLDPAFAPRLAHHARAVAEQFPWVRDWTPVNEPLTTARFAALYGHWYPHRIDERSFWTALLNQIDAIRLAMAEIRQVNPAARLIQTEDLGKTCATPPCAVQAQFDNERRWATWDLLEGRVTAGHPLWRQLCRFGLQQRLEALAAAPCPADVIGIDHYLTSDRFLDHRIDLYPRSFHGGSPLGRFADVEAVRVGGLETPGLETALRECWSRYGRTMAVTELHNACTREEQMRWFAEGWATARRLSDEGLAIEGVTAWNVLGSRGWEHLLTCEGGEYECGVFDTRSDPPRDTAMVPMLRELVAGKSPSHPALASPGWWRREDRMQLAAVPGHRPDPNATPEIAGKPVLITGASGTLGRALAGACAGRGLAHKLTSRRELDLSDPASMAAAIARYRPWAVINAAGWVRVDDAEAQEADCNAANCTGSVALARICADQGIHYTAFSSDLVFDGRKGAPYLESDPVAPLSAYGRSKATADAALAAMAAEGAGVLIARTAAFFWEGDCHNFADAVITTLPSRRRFVASDRHVISPTYVPDLVRAVLDLVIDRAAGIWHLANHDSLSWHDFARRIALAAGLDPSLIIAADGDQNWRAPRPAHVPLASNRGALLRPLDEAIECYVAALPLNPPLRSVEPRTG